MSTVKEEARRVIDELPDDVDWRELLLELELHARVARGLADMRAGRTIPAEEIEKKYGFKH
jgi:predicted transcriptional regulator